MWHRIAMVGLIPFAPLQYRPVVGCGLAALSLSVYTAVQPYHDPATNTLAVSAQWQLLVIVALAHQPRREITVTFGTATVVPALLGGVRA